MRCHVADLLAQAPAGGAARAGTATTPAERFVALACMLAAAVLWGSAFWFVAIALDGFGPITISCSRCILGAVVVGAFALLRRSERRATRATVRGAVRPVVLGGTFTAGALLGVAVGQQYVSSSVTGVVLGTVPIWTAALAAVLARRAGGSIEQAGSLAVALALGTAAGVVPALGGDAVATVGGVLVLFAAAVSHAGSMVSVPPGIARLGPVVNTALVMTVAAAVLAVPMVVAHEPVRWGMAPTVALLELGLLPTGIAYIAFFRAVALVGAPRATVAIYLIPLVALVTAAIGGASVTMGEVLGALLAVVAVGIAVGSPALASWRAQRRLARAIS